MLLKYPLLFSRWDRGQMKLRYVFKSKGKGLLHRPLIKTFLMDVSMNGGHFQISTFRNFHFHLMIHVCTVATICQTTKVWRTIEYIWMHFQIIFYISIWGTQLNWHIYISDISSPTLFDPTVFIYSRLVYFFFILDASLCFYKQLLCLITINSFWHFLIKSFFGLLNDVSDKVMQITFASSIQSFSLCRFLDMDIGLTDKVWQLWEIDTLTFHLLLTSR